MIFNRSNEFKKEFKKLCKKYHSLDEDLSLLEKVLSADPTFSTQGNNSAERISGMGKKYEHLDFYKIRKFRCKSISGTSKFSGIRIIYKYSQSENTIEFEEIEFVEIYHKNQRENHDMERLKKYLSE